MLSQTTNQTPLLKLCFCQFLRHSGYYRHKTELSASALVSPSWSINTMSYQREQSCSDTVAPMHHLNFRAHRDFTEAAWTSCSLCCLLPGLVFLGSQRMLEILTSLKYIAMAQDGRLQSREFLSCTWHCGPEGVCLSCIIQSHDNTVSHNFCSLPVQLQPATVSVPQNTVSGFAATGSHCKIRNFLLSQYNLVLAYFIS